jgi:hypothetical protein
MEGKMNNFFEMLATYSNLLIALAAGIAVLGSIVLIVIPFETFISIRQLLQGWYKEEYLGMQVEDNTIIHKIKYTMKSSKIPIMYRLFGTMPLKFNQELNLFQAEFDFQSPPFTKKILDSKWKLEKSLKEFLKTNKLKLTPSDSFIMNFIAPSASVSIATPKRTRYTDLEGDEFEEEYDVELQHPFDHSERVKTSIEIPGDWAHEDIIEIDIREDGSSQHYRARFVKEHNYRPKNSKLPPKGVFASGVIEKMKAQHRVYIQDVLITQDTKTTLLVRKKSI